MQLKSKVLALGSILTLLALTFVQGYLIYNTYQLKKKSLNVDARTTIARLYMTKEIDSIMWLYRNDFLNQIEYYKQNQISKDEVIENLKLKSSEINPLFLESFDAGLEKENQPFDLKLRKETNAITLKDNSGAIEVFVDKADPPVFLIGEDFNSDEGVLLNSSTWNIDHEVLIDGAEKTYSLEFQTRIFMGVENWERSIMSQMTGLMLLSSLIFVFVIGLFYYSIKNLKKQKRLADIKSDFINNITHELKTPLSTISIATKTLTNRFISKDKAIAKDAIQVINRQNLRLQKLIDQVVGNSLGYNEIVLTKEQIQLPDFLNNLLDDYALTLEDDIKLTRSFDRFEVMANVDTFYLGTVITNILNNAVKYGGSKIDVLYRVDINSSLHIIEISDNGIGISKKHQKYIFDKFYRVSEKDTHNYKGLGLGLYYSSQIVKAHHGTIDVRSNKGKGITFILTLPIV